MEFIAFVVLMGLFGRFIWSQLGNGAHGTGAPEGPVTSVSRENGAEMMGRSSRDDEEDDCRLMAGEDYHGSPDYVTDPAYNWMPGNIFHQEPSSPGSALSGSGFDSDWISDPAYSHLPGNIFHDTMTGDCSGSDWMTDPACSYMQGNIYHDDMPGSCTGIDTITDPACSFMPGNIFHDDGISSFSSDDSWSSSSFPDDSWSSSSSSDDW